MDFKKIRKNIKIHKYRCLDDIDADMTLLCKNAQTYNIEGSLVRQLLNNSCVLSIQLWYTLLENVSSLDCPVLKSLEGYDNLTQIG